MSVLDIARDYIAAGMSVLPVAYKTKKPIGDDWQNLRISAVEAPLFFNGREMNGVLMGEPSGGLSDVDLDSVEAIRAAPYLLPPTAAFGHSPSKPRSHYLYKSDLFATQTRAVIKFMSSDKRGILEIRVGGGGLGAQTIFPGSTHVSGEAIQWEESGALGKIAKVAGAELLKCCHRLAAAAELAMFYPQEGRRHGAAFVLGGFLARAGFSAPEAALFAEAVGAASDQSVEKVRDMKRTARDGTGADKKAGFPQLAETFGAATAKKVADWLGYSDDRGYEREDETREENTEDPYPLKWHGEPDDTPLKDWAVEGMLPKIGKALMVGQWGVYKTFLALDLSYSFMTKTPFAGRKVHRQGGVLFIAAEGQNEVRVRLAGIVQAKAAKLVEREGVVTIDPAHMPFVWIVSCPLLTSDTAAAELCTIIAGAKAEMFKRFGLPLVAVLIDTLMVAANFDDADDSSEAQRVMSVLTTAAVKSELLVIAVDHFGKNTSTGTRNSSVKEDAVEAVLAIIADKDLAGTVKNPRLAIRKQKAAATGEQIPFEMRPVAIGDDATTLVVDWSAIEQGGDDPRPSSEPRGKPWPTSLVIFKKALDNTLGNVGRRMRPFSDGPEVVAAKRDAVRAEFLKTYPADTDKAKAVTFLRCEKLALACGLMAMRTLGAEEEAATYFWRLGALF